MTYRAPLGWGGPRLGGTPPGVRTEQDCDLHIGPKALEARRQVEAAINRTSTKAVMVGARRRTSRKKRRHGR